MNSIDQLSRNKKWIVLFLAVFGLFSVDAQSVDSIQHNGEQFYVYPFRKNVDIHNDYWKVIDDDAFFADYNNYFNQFGDDYLFSRDGFQNAKTQKRKEYFQKELKSRWKQIRSGRGDGRSVTRAIRKTPGELIKVSYDHDKDVLPPFGTIPDGKYVQLFEDFCLVDEDGMCQSDAFQIAGYFTIKNNAIDGEAVWLDFKGDTLKTGTFANGLKEGEWQVKYPNDLPYFIRNRHRKQLRKGGSIQPYYSNTYTTFKNGLEHGPYRYTSPSKISHITGEFEFGEASGEWNYFTKSQLTRKMQMANPNDTTISKRPILRSTSMQRPRRYYLPKVDGEKWAHYDVECREASMPAFPNDFYEIQYEVFEEEIELEGENEKSFDLTDAPRYNEYNEFGTRYRFDRNSHDFFEIEPSTRRVFPRWFIMDSLGAHMKYEGVYEQYYMNGQLFYRYEVKNGQLLSEDTLFWDNGNPLDVIVFEPDSNKYFRSLYARDGLRYDIMIYDSIGKFIEFANDEPEESLDVMIDGVLAQKYTYDSKHSFAVKPVGFFYLDEDTLSSKELTSKVMLSRTWSGDTTIQTNIEYDPVSHEYISEKYNCFGGIHAKQTKTFTNDFSGWTGRRQSNYGDLSLKGSWSGVRLDFDEVDTLKHNSVNYIYEIYDVNSDISLYNSDELYTGKFEYKKRPGFFKIKAKSKKITVQASKEFFGFSKFYRANRKKKKRKGLMMESFTNGTNFSGASSQLKRDFLKFFSKLLYDQNSYLSYSAYDTEYGVKSVEGRFLDGKAHGIWTAYDKKGKVVSTVNFNRGEVDGELRVYDYQDKARRRRAYHWGGWYKVCAGDLDSCPKKRTRYLKHVVQFKNGLRQGVSVKYDWLGREVTTGNFTDNELDGKMITRDSETHTEATFKDGYLDGYLRTYLTFSRRDSILLYDINLQDGFLNGESKSYHTNGRLAKRGFFLDGEPIEDYESYDTLGFKFHYVKFQYGMPVEEKIWEENALSIRYQFNWRDSIDFYADDITSTQSLEALLAKEGYNTFTTADRYYGRPSLISKEEIECQMTKYYPNDTIARDGKLKNKQKIGLWKFYGYKGNFLYEAKYFDSMIVINDSIKFKSKGILTDFDDAGNRLYSSYIIEKFEKYDCAHTDHYETRQLITIDEENDSTGRMNGYVNNFYDNGTIQSEGAMKNGIPDGLWKFYDPYGKLNKMGNYKLGKRNGRWLEGDLAKKKYLGEICMNPNLYDLEEKQKYQENLLDVTIINYMMGKLKNTQFYDVNMNRVMEIEDSKNKN
jgi:antitoxin component YwqK of YwqJK toxin-antitoxin module